MREHTEGEGEGGRGREGEREGEGKGATKKQTLKSREQANGSEGRWAAGEQVTGAKGRPGHAEPWVVTEVLNCYIVHMT